MDIKTLLNNLHEEVSCSVCMNTFTDPKQLPCLHSFCLHCLQGIQRTSVTIACPECRRGCKVPGSGNLKDLPTNFRINSLLDVLSIKECNTTGVKCGNCDKRSAQSLYCFQCCAFWCDDCITAHNIFRANKEHRVLALKDFQDQNIEDVLKRPAFCPKPGHEKKELEFFCKNCEEPICNSCVATIHDGHVKILLEEAANERKLEFQSLVESKKKKAHDIRNKISKLDETSAKIQGEVTSVKRSVQQFVDEMVTVMEARKQEIFNEVEDQGKQSLQQLGIRKIDLEHEAEMIDTAVEKTETLLNRNTTAEIVNLDRSLNTIFPEGVRDERYQVDCDLEAVRRFIFERNETLLEKINTEGIGSFKTFLNKTEVNKSSVEGNGISEATVGLEAQVVLTTRNAEGEQCYEERDCVTVEIRNQQGHDCTTKAQVQDNKDGTYNISYFAKETGKCSASFKVNGNHVHGSPFSVQFKPRQYRPVLSFGKQGSVTGMLRKPLGVAVNERNEIVVTDKGNNRVQVFSSDGTYLRSFGRKGYEQGEFDWPSGVAFDKNGNIIVVDSSNNRVQLFNEQGKYLSSFGGKGNFDHQLTTPLGLSIDSDGNIIIAVPGNKLLKVFSPGGQFLHKVGEEGFFTYPYHCIRCNKCLIVSDLHENCIKMFDRDGNFLYNLGRKGERNGEFNEPCCLSVDKAGHLIVCDAGNHRVQVFEMSGKFITKFGTKGSRIGEFNKPVSAAVLSDGRIVVTDVDNDRIQIFE